MYLDWLCWQFPFVDITTAKLSFHTDTIEYLIMDTMQWYLLGTKDNEMFCNWI
jgi:hypothetical protein